MRDRLVQDRHIEQMKRHVLDRFRARFPFEQCNRNVVVADGDTISKLEFFLQPKRALEPSRAFLRIAHRQPEVTDHAEGEGNPLQCGSEPFPETTGSRKCRLKSSSASRGVIPKPVAPCRNPGPMKASQTSPAMPILGRSFAAGLRGCSSK